MHPKFRAKISNWMFGRDTAVAFSPCPAIRHIDIEFGG